MIDPNKKGMTDIPKTPEAMVNILYGMGKKPDTKTIQIPYFSYQVDISENSS